MRVRMISTAAGPKHGAFEAGREYDVPGEMPRELAEQFIEVKAAAFVAEVAEATVDAEEAESEIAARDAGEVAGSKTPSLIQQLADKKKLKAKSA